MSFRSLPGQVSESPRSLIIGFDGSLLKSTALQFASREQFAGVPVNIRSDLYSLDRATRPLEAYLVIGLFYADRPPD
jgi:hypothetical protein